MAEFEWREAVKALEVSKQQRSAAQAEELAAQQKAVSAGTEERSAEQTKRAAEEEERLAREETRAAGKAANSAAIKLLTASQAEHIDEDARRRADKASIKAQLRERSAEVAEHAAQQQTQAAEAAWRSAQAKTRAAESEERVAQYNKHQAAEVERLATAAELIAERKQESLAKERQALKDAEPRLANDEGRRMAAVAMQLGAGAPRKEGLQPGLLANAERGFAGKQSHLPMQGGPGPSLEAGLRPGGHMIGQVVCPHPRDCGFPLVCVDTPHQLWLAVNITLPLLTMMPVICPVCRQLAAT